jgi:hypothetical protein
MGHRLVASISVRHMRAIADERIHCAGDVGMLAGRRRVDSRRASDNLGRRSKRIHVALYRRTGGRIGSQLPGLPARIGPGRPRRRQTGLRAERAARLSRVTERERLSPVAVDLLGAAAGQAAISREAEDP